MGETEAFQSRLLSVLCADLRTTDDPVIETELQWLLDTFGADRMTERADDLFQLVAQLVGGRVADEFVRYSLGAAMSQLENSGFFDGAEWASEYLAAWSWSDAVRSGDPLSSVVARVRLLCLGDEIDASWAMYRLAVNAAKILALSVEFEGFDEFGAVEIAVTMIRDAAERSVNR